MKLVRFFLVFSAVIVLGACKNMGSEGESEVLRKDKDKKEAKVEQLSNFCGWIARLNVNQWYIHDGTPPLKISYFGGDEFETKGKVLESQLYFGDMWKQVEIGNQNDFRGYSCGCFDLRLTIPQKGNFKGSRFVTEITKVEAKTLDFCSNSKNLKSITPFQGDVDGGGE